ncbi:GGDEF domain-containing protein [Solemya velesiana gill symbiont]|uniref:diguanylate cyclase n=1 Tax=Solemya velesiana gill symbiont TaxID=1918948 RepID=A0A1T2KU55_9GAMM|nr:GGDEF domain-containing protein [Solemya velesiana gill symbiont]OOZ36385.1 hypothetical protein BOW51_07310 [Solemya velesiana gill symbiont]
MTDNSSKPECPVGEEICGHIDGLSVLRSRIDELSRLVHTDTLTGLFNFRHFSMVLEQELERTRRSGRPTSLVMMDLDHFKQVSDRWGHESGNRVLRQSGELITQVLRRVDIPCRCGGEEFALILPGTPLARAVHVAERLRISLSETPVALDGCELQVTASFGVNVYLRHSTITPAQFVEETDAFLYQAKAQGRDRVCHPDFESVKPKGQVGRSEKDALLGD